LQPILKTGLQVLNLRFEQSREEGRYVRSTLTAGRALPRRAHPRRPGTRSLPAMHWRRRPKSLG
jgi:hypothetical protein